MDDLNDKVTGGTLTAAEWNQVPSEIQSVIEGLGITLSGGDLNQLGKAIAGYVANGTFYTDSGAADAYVLSVIGSKQAPTAYTDGLEAVFIVGNTNTGASTVNVAGLGVKSIKKSSATVALAAGELVAGAEYILIFDLAGDSFDLKATTGIQIFTSSGSFTKPAGLKRIKVTAVAGGGGGGSSNAASTRGGGGAAGGVSISFLAASVLSASETVTIGAGGAGIAVAGGAGSAGGATSLGSLVTTNGGVPGSSASGGIGVLPGTGTFSAGGGDGTDGALNVGGNGGSSFFGGGSRSGNPVASGVNVIGAGGGGGTNGGQSASGKDGIIIIEEFF